MDEPRPKDLQVRIRFANRDLLVRISERVSRTSGEQFDDAIEFGCGILWSGLPLGAEPLEQRTNALFHEERMRITRGTGCRS